ncbi:MAG: hypothetical protein JXQ27_15425 [Acidobacteria bacterium]|nr:hypothetical protein [Acidobacteriota bacterium]
MPSFLRLVGVLLILLLPPAASCAGQTLIELEAPALLKFAGEGSNMEAEFLFRLHSVSPDLQLEWEHDFRLGAIVIPRNVLHHSISILKRTRLENGRKVTLRGNILGVSQEIYQQLEKGGKVTVKFDRVRGWMQKTGDTTYALPGRLLPAITVTDDRDNRYIIQKNPRFPLFLSFESDYYTERLVEYYHGEEIIFRWFK